MVNFPRDKTKERWQETAGECDLDNGYVSPIAAIRDLTPGNIWSALAGSRYLQILTALTVAGTFLRFYNLGFNSLWFDELFTCFFSRQTLPEIWQGISTGEFNPPLFFWIEHFMMAAGNSETVLRFVPALFGVLSIPVFYLAGKEFFDRNVGIIAAAGCAFSPFLIAYAQEARAYTLMLFFTGLATLFFLRADKDGTLKNHVLFGVFSALAFWSHYFAFTMVAFLVLFALVMRVPHFRTEKNNLLMLVAGSVVFLVLCSPLALIAHHHFMYKIGPSSFPLYGYVGMRLIGETFTGFSGSSVILLIVFAVGVACSFFPDTRRGLFLSLMLLLTLVTAYFFSFVFTMLPRYIIFLTIVFFIGIGMSYRVVYRFWSHRAVVYLFIVVLLVAAMPALIQYYSEYSKPDWRGFSRSLAERAGDGDQVIAIPDWTREYHMTYYFSPVSPRTRLFGADTAEDLEKLSSRRGNNTVYFVLFGDTLPWLMNNTRFAGTDTTGQISLFVSP